MRQIDRFIGSSEIGAILSVGKTHANEIMHIFGQRGQLYRIGRSLRVKDSVFNAWLEESKLDSRKHYLPANNVRKRVCSKIKMEE